MFCLSLLPFGTIRTLVVWNTEINYCPLQLACTGLTLTAIPYVLQSKYTWNITIFITVHRPMWMKYFGGLCFAPCKTQAFTCLIECGVAGQLMQLDGSQAYANNGMIHLELDKSCHVSRSVLQESHDDCHLPTPVCHVGTWNEIQ
jgi:hypothetical protein